MKPSRTVAFFLFAEYATLIKVFKINHLYTILIPRGIVLILSLSFSGYNKSRNSIRAGVKCDLLIDLSCRPFR